ncbi:MAG: hypothetical protein HOP10_15545 [Chitinophagaceae bacterium]|nr:hypothetical protein [Chitinophagaceae bacterium]
MKTFVLSLILSFFTTISFAQSNTSPDQATASNEVTIAELQLKPLKLPALNEIGGSPFLTTEFLAGSVQIEGGKIVTNVPVKFNIFSNVLIVQRDGDEMKLETFDLVSYDNTVSDGTVKHYMFKQGYPEIDKRPTTAIYQVLSYGPKLHFLKFLSQKIEEVQTLGDYGRRELATSQQYYTYVPGGEIKKIKPGKQAIVDALPAMSAKIEEIIKSKELNLKNESDLAALVDELNKG